MPFRISIACGDELKLLASICKKSRLLVSSHFTEWKKETSYLTLRNPEVLALMDCPRAKFTYLASFVKAKPKFFSIS